MSKGKAGKKSRGIKSEMRLKKPQSIRRILAKRRKKHRWQNTHIKKGQIKKKWVILYSQYLKMKKPPNRTMSHSLNRQRTEPEEKGFNSAIGKSICFIMNAEPRICWALIFDPVVLAFPNHMHLKLKQKNIKLNKQMIKWQSAKHKNCPLSISFYQCPP